MIYKKFTELLDKELDKREGLPKDRSYVKSRKNNGVVNNVVIIRNPEYQVAPSIHLDYYYNEYLKGMDLSYIADDIVEIYNNQPDFAREKLNFTWEGCRDSIYYVLVNRERNEDLLQSSPYIDFYDLALLFKIDTDFLGVSGSIIVDNNLIKYFNISVKDLLEAAVANSPIIHPLKYNMMADMMHELLSNLADAGGTCLDEDNVPDLYVVTSADGYMGASSILYEDCLNKVNETIGEDCYVLPSSINEVILVAFDENVDKEELAAMVRDVNASPSVSEVEYLSGRVYTFGEIRERYNEILKEYEVE